MSRSTRLAALRTDRVSGASRVFRILFFLHIIFIHGGAVLIDTIRFGSSPLAFAPPWLLKKELLLKNYGLELPAIYLIWVVIVVLLYFPCLWFAGVKARNKSVLLSYL